MYDADHLEAKQEAIKFWLRGIKHLPTNIKGVCCMCGRWFIDDYPEAHHGIIPRNRGVSIDKWWNLFPACQECHTYNLHTKQGMDKAISQLCTRISVYILGDSEPSIENGRQWINEQIDQLIGEGILDARLKPHV